jgi:hypothetical protein
MSGYPDGLVPFGPRSNCTLDLCPIEWSVFQYRPSIGANATFIAIFALLLAVQIFQGIRYRTYCKSLATSDAFYYTRTLSVSTNSWFRSVGSGSFQVVLVLEVLTILSLHYCGTSPLLRCGICPVVPIVCDYSPNWESQAR